MRTLASLRLHVDRLDSQDDAAFLWGRMSRGLVGGELVVDLPAGAVLEAAQAAATAAPGTVRVLPSPLRVAQPSVSK